MVIDFYIPSKDYVGTDPEFLKTGGEDFCETMGSEEVSDSQTYQDRSGQGEKFSYGNKFEGRYAQTGISGNQGQSGFRNNNYYKSER